MASFVDLGFERKESSGIGGGGFVDLGDPELVPSAKPKSSLLQNVIDQVVGGVDVTASTLHGISMYFPRLGAKAMGYAAGAVLPGVSGKELVDKYGQATESVTLKPGMIEELILGRTGPGTSAGELLGKAQEFLVPTEQLNENVKQTVKSLGGDEELAEQIGFWFSSGVELLAFKGYGELASSSYKGLASKVDNLKKSIEARDIGKIKDDGLALKKHLVEDLGATSDELRTSEGRQALIERQFAPEIRQQKIEESGVEGYPKEGVPGLEPTIENVPYTTEADRFIQRQREFTAGELASARPIGDILAEVEGRPAREILIPDRRSWQAKRWGTKTAQTEVPPKPRAEEPAPLIRRGEEEVQRTNKAAQESVERQRGLQRELEQARKAREEVKPRVAPTLTPDAIKLQKVEPQVSKEQFSPKAEAEQVAKDLGLKFDGMQEYPPQLNKPATFQFTTKDGITFNSEELSKPIVEAKLAEMQEMRKPKEKLPETAAKVSKVPKGEEPKEFSKKSIIKESGIEFLGDDYALYGKSEFETLEAAKKYLEDPKVKEYRENELNVVGSDLEVVKVGDKYRLAEPLGVTEAQQEFFDNYVNIEPIENRISRANANLGALAEDINKWKAGEDVNILETEKGLQRIAGEFSGDNPITTDLVGKAESLLTSLRKNNDLSRPKPSEVDPEIMIGRHPVKRNGKPELIYDKEGKPFKDMWEALEWKDKKGLEGIIEEHPERSGWIIEQTKAKSITYEVIPTDDLLYKSPAVRALREIAKDIMDSLKLDERGSISFKDLSPEKIETARRLIEDARRAGLSIREFAEKILGYTAKEVDAFEKLVKETIKNNKDNEPSAGTDKLQTGEIVNKRSTEWVSKKTGATIRVPKVFEGEREDFKTARKIEPKFSREWVPTVFAVKDFNSKVVSALVRRYNEIETIKRVRLKAVNQLVSDLRKEFKREGTGKPEELGDFLISRQEGGPERLVYSKIDPTKVKDFSKSEVVKKTEKILEEAKSIMDSTRLNSGKDLTKNVKDYFTFMYSEGLANKYGVGNNRFLDAASLIDQRYIQYTERSTPYAKARSKLGAKKALQRDPFDVLKRYLQTQIEHELVTPIVAKVAQLVKPMKDGVTTSGKPKFYSLGKDNPGLFDFLSRWGNTLAKGDVKNIGYWKWLEEGKIDLGPIELRPRQLINTMRRNIGLSTLGLNVRSGLVQLTAVKNTLIMSGLIPTAQGALDILSKSKRAFARANSNVLSLRSMGIEAKDVLRGNTKLGETVLTGAMGNITYPDYITALASWHTFYRQAKAKPLYFNDAKAFNYADELVTMTQGSGSKGHVAPIQRTIAGKVFTMFNTFTINDWNLLYKEVFGRGVGEGLSKDVIAKRMITAFVSMGIVNSAFRMAGLNPPFGSPIDEAIDSIEKGDPLPITIGKIALELLEPLPVISGSVRYGSGIGGAVLDAANDFIASIKDPTNEDKMDDAGSLWETGSKIFLPAPGIGQISKSRRVAEKGGTFWEIFSGAYPKSRKSRKGRSERSRRK